MKEPGQKPTRAIVAAVQLSGVSDLEFEASLTELRELAKTLGFTVTRTFTQKRSGRWLVCSVCRCSGIVCRCA